VRNATKQPLVPLIVAEQTLGSSLEVLIPAQKLRLAIKFKKIKQGCGEHESVNRLAQHNPMSIDAPHNDRWVFIAVESRHAVESRCPPLHPNTVPRQFRNCVSSDF
jgi:hypothetical protein